MPTLAQAAKAGIRTSEAHINSMIRFLVEHGFIQPVIHRGSRTDTLDLTRAGRRAAELILSRNDDG